MTEPDRLEELRAQFVEVDERLSAVRDGEERPAHPHELEELEKDRERLEAEIAALQNPVGLAVAGEPDVADVEVLTPTGSELVVSPAPDAGEIFRVLDAHDEAMILEEFQRRALKVMLYDFGTGKNRKVDLSYQGVNEAVRLLVGTGKLKIRIRPDVREIRRETIEGEEYVVATVYAEEQTTGYGQFGVAREPLYMEIKDYTGKEREKEGKPVRKMTAPDGSTRYSMFDSFAETKALNKAQRNALKTMIPERMRQTMIAMQRGDEAALKVITHGAGAVAVAELPPPIADERMTELNQRVRAAYDEIREISPTALLPGLFGVKVQRAQHSHEVLEALLGELEAMRDHLKEQAS